MRIKRALYFALGCLGLALGAVGAAVPLLPAFPFLVMAAFGFARSNERLHRWFIGSRLYRDNLEGFLTGRGMTRAAKARIMLTVTAVMAIGIYMMRRIPVGQIALAVVWAGHMVLFVWGIRTVSGDE
ncbi:MAG: DUF454 domain-containing protein [Clostridiales bacterium]|nr:DUF454 domain-containing protein [Clostridiales bacterium]